MMVLWQFLPGHAIFYFSFLDSMAKAGAPLPFVVAIFMAVVLFAAVVTHFLIERPFVRGLTKLLRIGPQRHAFAI